MLPNEAHQYAVHFPHFSSHRTDSDNGYAEMAERMAELAAQRLSHQQWYSSFRVRIAKVEREYGLSEI